MQRDMRSLAAAMMIFMSSFTVLADPSAAQSAKPQPAGTKFRDCPDCPEMIVVPAGSALLGTAPEGNLAQSPLRQVTIPRPIAVGIYDVTRHEYEIFARETIRKPHVPCGGWNGQGFVQNIPLADWRSPGFEQTDAHPVVCVTWHDAKDYVAWLNTKVPTAQNTDRPGVGPYRLLTGDEWEYAARAGRTTRYWWGDAASHDYANYGDEKVNRPLREGRDQWEYTSPVGSFPPNPFGLYDMNGNVSQWLDECHPVTPNDCSVRGERGGNFFMPSVNMRTSKYSWGTPDKAYNVGGFRVAKTLE